MSCAVKRRGEPLQSSAEGFAMVCGAGWRVWFGEKCVSIAAGMRSGVFLVGIRLCGEDEVRLMRLAR